jgi:hypothetical protein
MNRTIVGVDVSSGGIWINRAILAPDMEEHQFRIVVQLKAEPIPADLLCFQLVGDKFVVHPGGSRYPIGLPSYEQTARRNQARQRNVVRRVPTSRCLLAHPILSVDYGRLTRMKLQRKRKPIVIGLQNQIIVLPWNVPVTIPTFLLSIANSRQARSGTIGLLGLIKPPTIEIAESQMGQVEILNVPRGRLRTITIHRLAKTTQFEAEEMAVSRREIARVIPPLRLKIGMVEMVARELVMIAGQGDPSPARGGPAQVFDDSGTPPEATTSKSLSPAGVSMEE